MHGQRNIILCNVQVLISFHIVLCKSDILRNLNTAIQPFRNESLTPVDATEAVTAEFDFRTDILKV